MEKTVKYIFFGSTSDSVIVLDKIFKSQLTTRLPAQAGNLQLIAVVTQPPKPVGRTQKFIPTPVAVWANDHNIPYITFHSDPEKPWLYADEKYAEKKLCQTEADLLISACYGQKIPDVVIGNAKFGGLNIHPSLLPRWRGADPVPWIILEGDHKTGVTIVTLTDKFDSGKIVAQNRVGLNGNELPDPLRTRLFTDGSNLLIKVLPDYLSGKIKGIPQDMAESSYARKFTRYDGFVSWSKLQKAMSAGVGATLLERKIRAFSPWPGVWTKIKLKVPFGKTQDKQCEKFKVSQTTDINDKRLKILSANLQPILRPDKIGTQDRVFTANGSNPITHKLQLTLVQLEGKKPVPFAQFKSAYL